jgi:hypothetical protein
LEALARQLGLSKLNEDDEPIAMKSQKSKHTCVNDDERTGG